MAQLTQPQTSGFQVDELPPAGTFCGVILDIIDLFQVQRPKFENPSEKETLDVTRFLFGFQGQDGRLYKIQTREMRISGNAKSKLFQFLTGLLGHPPKYGWDYCELRGHPAMLTVMHQQGRKDPTKTYAGIASVAPLPHQLQSAAPPVAAFNYVRDPQQGTQDSTPAPAQLQQFAPSAAAAQTAYPHNGHTPQQPQPAPYQYPLHVPQGSPQQPTATPPQPQQQPPTPPTPAQQPQQAQQSATPPTPALPQQPQQPPTGLWNPETDDPNEVPF